MCAFIALDTPVVAEAVIDMATDQNDMTQAKDQKKKSLPKLEYEIVLEKSDTLSKDALSKKEQKKKENRELPLEIIKDFESTSLLLTLKNRVIYSPYALNKRIADDLESLKKILFSYGYYDKSIEVATNTTTTKTKIQFKITLGTQYRIRSLEMKLKRALAGPKPCEYPQKNYDVDIGKPFTAADVLSTFDSIITHMGTCGYPYAKIKSHKAILDRKTKSIIVIVKIDQGPFVRFGVTHVKQANAVSKTFIKNRSPLKEGAPFNQEKIDAYQDKLSTTKLFSRIEIEPDQSEDTIENNEAVDINVSVTEGPPRTIAAGVKYSTNDGIGLDTSWLHRNIFGKADRLKVEGHFGQNEQSGGITYDLPDLWKIDQTLKATIDFKKEDRDAYKSIGFGVSGVLHNELSDGWSYFYGFSFENAQVKEQVNGNTTKTRFGGVGIPLGMKLNRVNDALNPTKGFKLTGTLTPEFGTFGNSSVIAKSVLTGIYHIPLTENERYIISFWSRYGMLFGTTAANLPAPRRLYGGGSGSVRGYGYQYVSPLDINGKPIGGKSLFSLGVEPRLRIGNDWGIVTFVEGGTVSRKSVPDFKKDLLFGAGLGVRYYTDFGPIRADIAFPFKRRSNINGKKVDSAFQFYISIGQAF